MRQLTLTMFTGRSLLDVAAEKVRMFVERRDPKRLYVFFSAGKDSAAALAAVVYAGDSVVKRVVVVYNELVGNTARLNVEQARRILEKLGFDNIVVVESPPYERIRAAVLRNDDAKPFALHIRAYSRHHEDFWRSVERWGLPLIRSSGARWCYNEFKEKHWRYLPPEPRNGRLVRHVVVGVKITDSHWRSKRWREADDAWSKVFTLKDWRLNVDDYAISPILKFTSDEVWGLLREAGLDKDLVTYHVYGDSLNCVICPLRSIQKQREILEALVKNGVELGIVRRAEEALRRKASTAREGVKTTTVTIKLLETIQSVLRS